MFNIDNAIAMMAQIEKAEDERRRSTDSLALRRWEQSEWALLPLRNLADSDLIENEDGTFVGFGSCGSSKCAAGIAATLAGTPLVWERAGVLMYKAARVEDGRYIDVVATEWLGIDWDKVREDAANDVHMLWDFDISSLALFSSGNSIDTLYGLLAQYAALDGIWTTADYLQREARKKAGLDVVPT